MPSRALVLSFSPVCRDARVLRHVAALAARAEVTTCGYGPAPVHGEVAHVRLPDAASSLPASPAGVAALTARRFGRAASLIPAALATQHLLAGQAFDLVVANDARSLPAAFEVARGAPVWADMHEWAPEERTHDLRWRLLVAPLMDELCRRHLPAAALVTTVSQTIAALYQERYGVGCHVLRNAAPYAPELAPAPLQPGRLRIVHSGAATPGRRLEVLVRAVRACRPGTTLDLYLVPGGDGGRYLARLRREAAGDERVRLREPVLPGDLPRVLNGYDVGAFVMPPVNANARAAMPNKLFDFVQARLALLVSPNPDMASLVRHHGLGVVTRGYDTASVTAALQGLDPVTVVAGKEASHRCAPALSAEAEQRRLAAHLEPLLA